MNYSRYDRTDWMDWLKIAFLVAFCLAGVCAISECLFASKNYYFKAQIIDKIYIPDQSEYMPVTRTDSNGNVTMTTEYHYKPEKFRVILTNDGDILSVDTTRRIFYSFQVDSWVSVGIRQGCFSGFPYAVWIDE